MSQSDVAAQSPEETAGIVAAHYDACAEADWRRSFWKPGYYNELLRLLRHVVLPGERVLDIGCGNGDVLASLRPARGVGIDVSPRMIDVARERHGAVPEFEFHVADACTEEAFDTIDETFDVICVAGVMQEMHDVQRFLRNVRRCCTPRTRLIIVGYSHLWKWPLLLAEHLGLKRTQPVENWLAPEFVSNLLYLCDYDVVRELRHLVFPYRMGPVSRVINRYIGHLPIVSMFSMLYCTVARPMDLPDAEREKEPSCSVVIPCRNESGHVAELHDRLPKLPKGSEVLWVEGNSTDDTEQVLRDLVRDHPDHPYRFLKQPGKGKNDAVRHAFAHAEGDVLLILDADVTVPPEDIPKFVNLLAANRAEFVNGTRLVYPLGRQAMRFLNLLGNKFFALLFRRLIGQMVSDTLCGTKVMWRCDYEKLARNRSYFGEFDPFGDFDLLLGAARMNLKIVELPIRYGARTYGETNISRFSHGWLLLRMVGVAARKIHFI
jgi:SAM-dependent methyltransferase